MFNPISRTIRFGRSTSKYRNNAPATQSNLGNHLLAFHRPILRCPCLCPCPSAGMECPLTMMAGSRCTFWGLSELPWSRFNSLAGRGVFLHGIVKCSRTMYPHRHVCIDLVWPRAIMAQSSRKRCAPHCWVRIVDWLVGLLTWICVSLAEFMFKDVVKPTANVFQKHKKYPWHQRRKEHPPKAIQHPPFPPGLTKGRTWRREPKCLQFQILG